MRTTIDIPDEMYRSLKMIAVERTTTVRQIVLDGLSRVLLEPATRRPAERLKLPLIRSSRSDRLELDSEKIDEIVNVP